ncbi:type II secretion system protein [Candidatus Parcubacteria bacterium]|nr:type II secretion system protein [Candidatus Parcubacteria bacterium]
MKKTFTLIETLVAISIFLFAISFIVSGFSRFISAQQTVTNQLIAAYLAQDAIETIRNQRDTNWLTQQNWNNLTNSQVACSPLKFSQNIGYNCSVGNPTIFSRQVQIQNLSSNEVLIQVSVSWREKWGNATFSVAQKLYNWLSP